MGRKGREVEKRMYRKEVRERRERESMEPGIWLRKANGSQG